MKYVSVKIHIIYCKIKYINTSRHRCRQGLSGQNPSGTIDNTENQQMGSCGNLKTEQQNQQQQREETPTGWENVFGSYAMDRDQHLEYIKNYEKQEPQNKRLS